MIPEISKKQLKSYTVSDFSGGVNLFDEPEKISDNQLTQGENVWFYKGALRTRPALRAKKHEDISFINEPKISVNKMGTTVINNKHYRLEKTVAGNHVTLRYVSDLRAIFVGEVFFQCDSVCALAVEHQGDIYLFAHATDNTDLHEIYLFKKIGEGQYDLPQNLTLNDAYVPTVLTNGRSCFSDSGKINSMIQKGATLLEGFNLLSDRYKMEFSTYDTAFFVEVEVGNIASRVSYMEYGLPYTPPNLNDIIYLEYVDASGKRYDHSVRCPKENDPTVENYMGEDGLYLHAFVKGDVCHVSLNANGEKNIFEADVVSIKQYVNNNMIINAPRLWKREDLKKVTSMTAFAWYGNTSLGINGGSRLFLGGEKGLVLWSDFEKPLYFPENNYAYVGDKGQKITAFAHQGPNLIIFKENEIYSTQYVQGELTENVDITQLAYFPMTLIHPTIGCDCPDTVELVRNRLVFLNSSGKVYTITSQSQYSEHNVYEISQMIAPLLEKEDLKCAVSADWCGRYFLFIKNRAYLMDYNTFGFVNISSCNKETTAAKEIPWFTWSFPQNIYALGVYGGDMLLWAVNGEYKVNVTFLDENQISDQKGENFSEEKIKTVIETKHFDFDLPGKDKIINNVSLEMIKTGPTTVEFLTDNNVPDMHSGFFNKLVPHNRIVKKLALKIKSENFFVITSLSVLFRQGR